MYCRNCGAEIDSNATVCLKCGFSKDTGNKYCQNCGKETQPDQTICMNCGFALSGVTSSSNESISGSVPEDKRMLCGLLAILVTLGIHNFILGETKKGILHILLVFPGVFLCGIPWLLGVIWSIIEGVKILNRSYVVDPDKWFAL